jgi:hypothetical protein
MLLLRHIWAEYDVTKSVFCFGIAVVAIMFIAHHFLGRLFPLWKALAHRCEAVENWLIQSSAVGVLFGQLLVWHLHHGRSHLEEYFQTLLDVSAVCLAFATVQRLVLQRLRKAASDEEDPNA